MCNRSMWFKCNWICPFGFVCIISKTHKICSYHLIFDQNLQNITCVEWKPYFTQCLLRKIYFIFSRAFWFRNCSAKYFQIRIKKLVTQSSKNICKLYEFYSCRSWIAIYFLQYMLSSPKPTTILIKENCRCLQTRLTFMFFKLY